MKIYRFLTLTVCCLAPLIQAADRHAVDWSKLESETMGHYISLLRIDTSNPPGDETKPAGRSRFVKTCKRRRSDD